MLAIGPTSSKVISILNSQHQEVLAAIAKIEKKEVQDIEDIARGTNRAITGLKNQFNLTDKSIGEAIKNIKKSGFFMGSFHERLVEDIFHDDISSNMLVGLKSKEPVDIAKRHEMSELLEE